jgi:enoyl-CoA hydratase
VIAPCQLQGACGDRKARRASQRGARSGDEAFRIGLANRVVELGAALVAAKDLVSQLAAFPQLCLRSDRASAYESWTLPLETALRNEYRDRSATVQSGETRAGTARVCRRRGRRGRFSKG